MPDRRGRLFNGEYYLTMVRHLFDGAEEPRTEDAAVKLPWAPDAGSASDEACARLAAMMA